MFKRIPNFVTVMLIGLMCFFASGLRAGEAVVRLVDAGVVCNGGARVVHIQADLTGLTDDQGSPVGLNAFILALEFSNPAVVAVQPGAEPALDWRFQHRNLDAVSEDGRLLISGVALDPKAPGGLYQLATLFLSGVDTSVLVSLDVQNSSLAGKATGSPAGALIPLMGPEALTVAVPSGALLDPTAAAAAWGLTASDFDFDHNGRVEILDLAAIFLCGGPL